MYFICKFMCFYFIGDMVIFEIFSKNINLPIQVKLDDISKSFRNPLNGITYKLLGVVVYKRPVLTRAVQTLGHYTAMCLRVGQTWLEYNDLEKKERNIKGTSLITAALLIYSN